MLFIIVLFTFLPSDISFDIIFQRLAKRWNSHVSRMYAARTKWGRYVVEVHLVPGFIVRWNEGPRGQKAPCNRIHRGIILQTTFNRFLNRAESRLGR